MIIVWSNDLSTFWCQAITRIDTDLSSINLVCKTVKKSVKLWYNSNQNSYTCIVKQQWHFSNVISFVQALTQWGWVTHIYICVGNLTIVGSDNGLLPGRRQAIIWTNAAILLIGPLRTNFNEILIKIHTFSFKKIDLKMLSGKWQPFYLGLNVLMR